MKVTKQELRKITDFVSLINELGPEAFASALVRAFGDLERADDTVAYIRRMG